LALSASKSIRLSGKPQHRAAEVYFIIMRIAKMRRQDRRKILINLYLSEKEYQENTYVKTDEYREYLDTLSKIRGVSW
jgi:hypothetical protein